MFRVLGQNTKELVDADGSIAVGLVGLEDHLLEFVVGHVFAEHICHVAQIVEVDLYFLHLLPVILLEFVHRQVLGPFLL